MNDADIRLEVCNRLVEWHRRPQALEPLLDRALQKLQGKCNTVQMGIFTHLVNGIIRWQRRLDHYIFRLQRRPRRLQPEMKALLRLGLFELDPELGAQRPTWAVVSESVELARRLLPGREGFVNAVLRAFLRQGSAKLLPAANDLSPEALGIRWSLPDWLAAGWLADYGPEKALRLCRRANHFAGTTFRVNRLRLSREKFLSQTAGKKSMRLRPGVLAPAAVIAPAAANLLDSVWFRDGLVSVQDEGAQLVSEMLAPRPGELILDACAAPGGKSTHLAELSGDRARIFALDRDRKRLPLIMESARRLGLEAITTATCDLTQPLPRRLQQNYDAILIDAPCSGLGTIRRRADLRWRKKPGESRKLAALQLRILDNCSQHLKKGGRLLYATCTTTRAENQEVVRRFLSNHNDYRVAAAEEIEVPHIRALLDPEGFLETSFLDNAENSGDFPDVFFAALLLRRP